MKGEGPIECVVFPGAVSGVQVDGLDGALTSTRSDVAQRLSQHPAKATEAPREWMHLVRLLAGAACVSEITTPSHPTLKIPKEVIECGLLSCGDRTQLVFFASGSILEVWNTEPWREYLRRLVTNTSVRRGLYDEPFDKIVEAT